MSQTDVGESWSLGILEVSEQDQTTCCATWYILVQKVSFAWREKRPFGVIGAPIFAAALSFAPNSKHKPGKCLRFEKERQGRGADGDSVKRRRSKAGFAPAWCRVLTEKMQEQSLVSQGFAGF